MGNSKTQPAMELQSLVLIEILALTVLAFLVYFLFF